MCKYITLYYYLQTPKIVQGAAKTFLISQMSPCHIVIKTALFLLCATLLTSYSKYYADFQFIKPVVTNKGVYDTGGGDK